MSQHTVLRNRLSQTVASLKPSGIRRFFDLAASMEGVISLGVGEPDFVTPWRVREACISSLERGYTAYTSNAGLLELRKEIHKYLEERFFVSYHPETEMLITVGASEAIDIALRAIIDPGDEVLVVEPCYVSYEPVIRLAGGEPVFLRTNAEQQFKLTPEELEAHISPRTKAIIFCYPNNPTGSTMTAEEWSKLLPVIEKHDLLVISDEIYAELTYGRMHDSIAALPGMKDRTILISGFSKAFAMTGWRLGYVCASPDLLAGMLKIHQYTMLCAPVMAQMAALEALRHGQADMERMVESYRQRRNFVVQGFQDIGLACHEPEGAFYAFPSIRSTGLEAAEFAERLLMEEKVAVVPGDVFGDCGKGHIRCSYATSLEQLQKALERMGRFVQKVSAK
ncbi:MULTISPECIES: aminotransferase [Brevibacillus]|jgi:aminotransferase|uniref:Aminotransferase n=1 Tax=Brevibacillus borstelensis AK1 TaxID=1300222 RepID=M8E462_9BACL|nr:aminotransferase [Brevibacillus borstelensis]EMT50270.1 aminotransferase [Brevibacillus borstelensis AK1]MBE5395676.1 aminotransferase [Brevibacillus borstelensis]MCC0565078.1 aminotransferase [Brevibacillus borstelensis]MCM3471819.1 aminotransferase [Brevibacillus borstelensis]MCM3561052.1 aminotransferase [Brevibacillus borstelensis]